MRLISEEIFGKNNFVGVLFESDDVFSVQSLEKLNEIADSIEAQLPYVEAIYSIASLTYREMGMKAYEFSKDGLLVSSLAEQENIRSTIEGDPSLSGTLFSKNRKITIIAFEET